MNGALKLNTEFKNVTWIDHPLVQHKVSLLRDENTSSKDFRQLVSEIATLMCFEATRDLPLKEVEVKTPVGMANTNIIAGRKLAVVPILRFRVHVSVTSVFTATTRLFSLLNITASFLMILRSGTLSSLTPCLQQAALPLMQ